MSLMSLKTDRFLPHDRLAAWQGYVEDALFDVQIRPFNPNGLVAESHARLFGETSLMTFSSNEHLLDRGVESIQQTPKSTIMLSTMITGTATYYSGTQSEIVSAGEMLVYDPQVPYVLAFGPNTRQVLIEIPPELLGWKPELSTPGRKVPLAHLDRTQIHDRFMHQLFRDASAEGGSPRLLDEQCQIVVRALRKLIGRESDYTIEIIDAAKNFIEREALRHEITAAEVAAQVNVSARHLNRLLAIQDLSISQYISQVRMSEASRRLEETTQSISAIAQACGFGSSAHFTRAFTNAHGCSPSSYRSAAVPVRSGQP